MGCNSDYLTANTKEISLSRVACLLDELAGLPFNSSHWVGYHPKVYNKHIKGDALVSELCSKLQSVDVSKYSLEMQTWWRDHKKADTARLVAEIEGLLTEELKAKALAKLTAYERKLLGV